MAGTPGPVAPGAHPVKIPPVRPLYRFFATGLGATMWFFVGVQLIRSSQSAADCPQLMYRAKKDGAVLLGRRHPWDH
ncbi:hypothetical protein BJ878DRAFT_490682 [Calycina marina]|uniref:Uncharacterized protein n=1 Tax=Calycina marina TaxID=1763456 RepID=A0A9P7Z9T9_9HELO|nr:hypothetical protein BJ878DRAFT_490682 [Calycina marina]